jgi:hypothetical protein
MSKQHFYLTRTVAMMLLIMLAPTGSWAGHVNSGEALKKAQAFMMSRGMSQQEAVRMSEAPQSRRSAGNGAADNSYYVFNVGDDAGFVIVSGDDRMADILGYADRGSIGDGTMPDALRYLLDGYAQQKAWIDQHGAGGDAPATTTAQRAAAVRTAIAPLVATRWNQGTPYNNNCPLVDEERTVTGCVATSMAQVMYYHQFPTSASAAIPGYKTRTLNLNVDGLPATTFDWNNMTTTYTSSSTGAAADAVALLMQYCGAALQMNYNVSATGGSSAYNASISEVLKVYFGYDGTTNYVQRHHYSYQQWVDMIYCELAENRPVILGGQSGGGGHSFVCDGYDAGDYFHINWGWGGSSDGYFRLSALNPSDQGIGGSSSLDGFSYTQDAVVGIAHGGVTTGNCLTVEVMQFNEAGTTTTQTVNREKAEDAFTGINLYTKVYSYMPGTHTYDYAIQMINADGSVLSTLHEADDQSIEFNKGIDISGTDFSTIAALADGTYYIKAVSRPAGSSSWLDCNDGRQFQLTATVSGNTLTLTASIVTGAVLTLKEIKVEGDLTKGHEQKVTVSVTGGSTDYHNNIVLNVNDKTVMGKTVDIPAGTTVDVPFYYTPNTAGDNKLTIHTNKGQIGTETITITDSDVSNTQTLTATATIDNLSGGKLYGNAVKVTAHVTNTSADYSYAGKLTCSVREYDSADAERDNYLNATTDSKSITIGKNGTTDVDFEIDGLKLGKFYRLRFTYIQGYQEGGKDKKRSAEALLTESYEMGEGYLVYLADGTRTIAQKASTISAGDNAVCVDLTSITSFTDITVEAGSNPNCVYLLAEGMETPAGLTGCNVVCNGSATTIALTDGYDFYTPVSFTAENISYTRTFTVAAAGTSGWNTIMLPFSVSAVTVGGASVDWFRNASDKGKNFWVRAFVRDGAGVVNFDYAKEMAAYTPYIIAVPDDRFGEAWQMTGKPVTFSGSNATITAITGHEVSGNNYQFCGTTKSQALTNVYALNDAGSSFVRQDSYNVPAFRAWFSPISISSLNKAALSIGSGEATGIAAPQRDSVADTSAWYTLSGARLAGRPVVKGLYIHQGKKVIIR